MESKKKKGKVPVVLVTKIEADEAVARLEAIHDLLWRIDVYQPEYLSEFRIKSYDINFILAIFRRFQEKFESCGKYKENYQAKIMGVIGVPGPTGTA